MRYSAENCVSGNQKFPFKMGALKTSLLLLLGVLATYVTANNQYLGRGRNKNPYYIEVISKTEGSVWPKPQNQTTATTYLQLLPDFTFSLSGSSCAILDSAFERYSKIIFDPPRRPISNINRKRAKEYLKSVQVDPLYQGTLTTINVQLRGTCELWPYLDMDEHYELKVDSEDLPGEATLIATTTWGILRGLETFSQLVYRTKYGVFQINSTLIDDYPRFSHRGILLDTARHYLPKQTILDNIDALAYNKLNVLHWHIVDDQSFPYQSIAFPELSEKGAYNPDTHIYSPTDITEIIEYARQRGIRVVPEFDSPGHTLSWGEGYPGILTPCYSSKDGEIVPDGVGPMDPTHNTTFDFMKTFLQEVIRMFPDKYVHLGGDEVSFDCWKSNPDVTAWMQQMGFGSNYDLLEQYYMNRVLDIVNDISSDASYVVWQEIIDNQCNVKSDTVVEVWKDPWPAEMAKVTGLGYRTLLSTCWYLDYISYGADWKNYYACEPLSFDGTEEQKKLVVGGEACLWAEFVDGTNVTPRLWPRASAAAEKLWSAINATSVEEATPRLEEHRCRLLVRGINAEPANGPSFCDADYKV